MLQDAIEKQEVEKREASSDDEYTLFLIILMTGMLNERDGSLIR
jgi:hypothetical protein